jgi:hypothetical protein
MTVKFASVKLGHAVGVCARKCVCGPRRLAPGRLAVHTLTR